MTHSSLRIHGLITARGGSRGIPRKNVLPLAGKPVLAWTIEAALASPRIDRVVLSTDDEEIARVGRQWGAEVPFLRPPELATADAGHFDVVLHALDWLRDDGDEPDYVMLLQPTSPLRTATDIDNAVAVAERHGADSVVSVAESHDRHPYLMRRIGPVGQLELFVEAPVSGEPGSRRQALPPAYFLNGAVYLSRVRAMRSTGQLLPGKPYPYIMPANRSWQLDEPCDLDYIQWVLTRR